VLQTIAARGMGAGDAGRKVMKKGPVMVFDGSPSMSPSGSVADPLGRDWNGDEFGINLGLQIRTSSGQGASVSGSLLLPPEVRQPEMPRSSNLPHFAQL